MTLIFYFIWSFVALITYPSITSDSLIIKKSIDFQIDGTGSAVEWQKTSWVNLPFRHGPVTDLETKAKILYSENGIYFLFKCHDNKLTATFTEDFANLYQEDVVEVFLWTDERYPVYFEYELSPLNFELPILIFNFNNKSSGWRPWHYEGNRRTRHFTHVKRRDSAIFQWTAEFFIPYALLSPSRNVPPQSGSIWRANMYRIDYDGGQFKSWQWQPTSGSFHEFEKFGNFIFQ